MTLNKYRPEEKKLCNEQVLIIKLHLSSCGICKSSFDSGKTYGIPTKPACKEFMEALKTHVEHCYICNQANKKWNVDAIPVSDKIRLVVSRMESGKMPNIEDLKTVGQEIMDKLNRKK